MLEDKSKWERITQDPTIREGTIALARTSINVAISYADVIPVVGEFVSWGADIAKTYRRIVRSSGQDPKFLDLTPDVSLKWALGSEVLEYPSAGFAPTHAAETGLQLLHDIPRMGKGVWSLIRITFFTLI